MNKDKPSAQTDIPGKGLFARYPLTFYFIIAYVDTWLVWSLFVLPQNGPVSCRFESDELHDNHIRWSDFRPRLSPHL